MNQNQMNKKVMNYPKQKKMKWKNFKVSCLLNLYNNLERL